MNGERAIEQVAGNRVPADCVQKKDLTIGFHPETVALVQEAAKYSGQSVSDFVELAAYIRARDLLHPDLA